LERDLRRDEKWSDDRQKKVKLAEDVPSELDGLLKIVDSLSFN
jgi:hypothetical protein